VLVKTEFEKIVAKNAHARAKPEKVAFDVT
jgi:hypothetical protein